MKYMSKFTFSILLILTSLLVNGQTIKTDSIPPKIEKYGVRFGADISKLIQSFYYKNEIINIVNDNQNNTNLASSLESIQQIKNIFSEVKTEQLSNAFKDFLSPLENVINQTNELHNYSLYNSFLANIQNIQNKEFNNLRNELSSYITQNSNIQIVNESALRLAQYINQNNLSNNLKLATSFRCSLDKQKLLPEKLKYMD